MSRLMIVALCVTVLCAGCAQTRQPPCAPNAEAAVGKGAAAAAAGGQNPVAAPQTGWMPGAPNPVSSYAKGDQSIDTAFAPESRTAGTIANPKAWTADTNAIASAPMSAKCAAQLLESLAMKYVCEVDPDAKRHLLDTMVKLVQEIQAHQVEYIGAIAALAPRFTRCVMVNLDLAGSSTGGQDAVDPANAGAAATGVPATVERAGAILNAEFEDSPASSEEAPDPDEGGGP